MFQEKVDSLSRGGAKAIFHRLKSSLRSAERSGDKDGVAWALLNIGMILRGQREYISAIQVLEKARANFTASGNDLGHASVLIELSYANRELNRNALALQYAHQAVAEFLRLNRPLELAWAYDNISIIHFNLSRRSESLAYAKKARLIFTQFNYQSCLAWNACNLGSLFFEMGFYAQSQRYFEEALSNFSKTKNPQGEAWALLWLGMLARARSSFEKAEEYLEKARVQFDELDLKDRVGWCLLNLAAVHRSKARDEEAMVVNRKAIQLFSPIWNHDGVAWGLFQIGQILRDRGQLVKAWQTVRKAFDIHSDILSQKGMGWVENELGQIYSALNDQAHARECFVRAKVKAEQLDALPLKAEVDKNLGHHYLDEGSLQKGLELFDRSESICRKIQAWEVAVEISLGRCRHGVMTLSFDRAHAHLQAAEDFVATYGLDRLAPTIGLYQAELLASAGDITGAVDALNEVMQRAQKTHQRRLRTDVLLGLVQLQMTSKNPVPLDSLVDAIEKDARAIGSKKLKAKLFIVKGFLQCKADGAIDNRFFAQGLQILEEAQLTSLRLQTLDLLVELHRRMGREREGKRYEDMYRQLIEKNPVDFKTVASRRSLIDILPVSLLA